MTIKDIARESGYAISTVSRALNNHPDVSRTAKAKIEQIVAQYGFEPNKNARQLKAVQSKSICLLVKGTFNTFFASIVERMQALICEAGFTAEVHYADEDANEVLIAKTICKEAKPMGIIFLGGNKQNFHDFFDGIDIPCVLSTTYFTDIENKFLSTVGVDDVTSAKMAVDYLIDNGHTKIGVLGSNPQTSYTSRKRLEGAIDSYKEKGDAAFDVNYFEMASYTLNSAYRAMKRLLARRKDITAVFAMSDVMAIGACKAVFDLGKKVPEDISVVGFDGIEFAEYYTPKLTTIKQPQEEIARLSVALMLQNLGVQGSQDLAEDARHIEVKASLIEGESVEKV